MLNLQIQNGIKLFEIPGHLALCTCLKILRFLLEEL